jgi:hypothetical protein
MTPKSASLATIDLEVASHDELWTAATVAMRAEAEQAASAAMASLFDPMPGAREIVLAAHLRRRLAAERKGISDLLSGLAKS